MSAPGPGVLMIGTAPDGKGGIAAAVTALQGAGFFERHAVRYLVTHRDGARWRKLAAALGAAFALVRACRRQRGLIVHAHSASHASFWRKSLLLALARRCGAGTVFHLHGGGFGQFACARSGPLARWWIRHTLASSSAVVTLSEGWAGFLRGWVPRARVWVVPNAVALPVLAATPAPWPPGRILFLGRAEEGKGVFDLLDALGALRARLPARFGALHLAIGGDGDLAAVRRRIGQLGLGAQVSVLGWLEPAARELELARAAIFALPSHTEGLPMSLLEAMAAGKAVVVSAVGAMPEVVRDRENGLVVAPRDPGALAGALAALLENDGLRARLGWRARATVIERYSTAVAMEKLAAVYAGVALVGPI